MVQGWRSATKSRDTLSKGEICEAANVMDDLLRRRVSERLAAC